ncbi:hypothetical protein L1049_020426 [Liquidambar formosana]|uniref:Uncharacterized protein n=1 Tax=Liquidambar formosana TaxID=63359 RepID=A0AAP0SBB5_LIQFO
MFGWRSARKQLSNALSASKSTYHALSGILSEEMIFEKRIRTSFHPSMSDI